MGNSIKKGIFSLIGHNGEQKLPKS
jgi:hypothetical protein